VVTSALLLDKLQHRVHSFTSLLAPSQLQSRRKQN
jgi:hypothetical protein